MSGFRFLFFFSSRRRHTRFDCDWSSDVCSSDLERRELAAVEAVLARWIVASLDRALVGEAARALEEELHPLTPAEPALRVAVPRHGRLLHPPPLGRAAPVVRDRRHVADRGDLEPHGLERADGGLPAGPGPTHEDLDLLEPVLHRLARGDLRGRLRGEGCALAGAPEAGAPGAGPGDDVAHPVGEGDDRVVEGRLDVRDARTDLAPLALLAALLPWRRLLLVGHALGSCLLRRGRGRRRGPRRRRRGRRQFLLDHYAAGLSLPRPPVRVPALSAHREPAPVAYTSIATHVHESLHRH